MSRKTVHSASCFRVNVIEFELVNSNDYGSESHGDPRREASWLSRDCVSSLYFISRSREQSGVERKGIGYLVSPLRVPRPLFSTPSTVPPAQNLLFSHIFFLYLYPSPLLFHNSFSRLLSWTRYPLSPSKAPCSTARRSFFSARIIRSFSPLMSGNYGVSTANDQWRSMIPLAEGEHALRVNRRSFVRQQQNKGEKERV